MTIGMYINTKLTGFVVCHHSHNFLFDNYFHHFRIFHTLTVTQVGKIAKLLPCWFAHPVFEICLWFQLVQDLQQNNMTIKKTYYNSM